MNNATLSQLLAQINALPKRDETCSVAWVGPSTHAAIQAVEEVLGVKIQGSFRDLILATGGGGLDSLYISPIPKDDPLFGCYADTMHYREDWCPHKLPPHLVVIQRDWDDNEPVCLDTSIVQDGENPVVLAYYQSTGEIEKIADSFFLDYYCEWLAPYLDESAT